MNEALKLPPLPEPHVNNVPQLEDENWHAFTADQMRAYARAALAERAAERTQAATDVLAERQRQMEKEGWTPEHDDGHEGGEMAEAAACYAWDGDSTKPPVRWPWSDTWWKPKGRRSNLVRAAALLLAEIERLDRAAAPKEGK